MKLNKYLLMIPAATMVACNNSAPEGSVEAKEAEEVVEVAEAAVYEVNTQGDEVKWYGYKTYADGSHTGTLQVTDGHFKVEEGNLVGGEFVIDMQSIHSTDLANDKEMYGKLVGHLKSPDFFAVDSFPTAKFEITEVSEASADDTTGATHMLSGNLTMRGETKNITIPAMVKMDGNMIKMKTPEFVIDRSKWNVRFRSTSFAEFADIAKDKAIDNNIKLSVNLSAEKA